MADLMTGFAMVLALAVLRFGLPALITWLVGRVVRQVVPAAG